MKVALTCALLLGAFGVILAQSNLERVREEEEGQSSPGPDHVNINDLPPYLREMIKNMKGEAPDVVFSPENMVPGAGGCSAGFPGVPGKNGMPGRNGLNGLTGPKGDAGSMGPVGPMGPMGPPGKIGAPGLDGTRGNDGPMGIPGVPGRRGLPGLNGMPGRDGLDGQKGKDGKDRKHLWKQCAWMEESDQDEGIIKTCNFTKMHQSSWLKVSFSGNIRVGGCSNCCGRWFFTFNGQECSNPVPIDAAVYMVGPTSANPLRPRHIEGFCGSIPKGMVDIAFSVGKCTGFGVSNSYTGWGSASRIIIEEVPQPQE